MRTAKHKWTQQDTTESIAMNVYYACKYTPLELIEALGATPVPVEYETVSFDAVETRTSPNICGFAKSLIAFALSGKAEAIVLTNCCDAMRRTFDVLKHEITRNETPLKFVYLIDLPHETDERAVKAFTQEMQTFGAALADFLGSEVDEKRLLLNWERTPHTPLSKQGTEPSADTVTSNDTAATSSSSADCLSQSESSLPSSKATTLLYGAHATSSLIQQCRSIFGESLENATCSGPRYLPAPPRALFREAPENTSCPAHSNEPNSEKKTHAKSSFSTHRKGSKNENEQTNAPKSKKDPTITEAYSAALLKQNPCYRMVAAEKRISHLQEKIATNNAAGCVFHTMKFCDFYGFEYARLIKNPPAPLLKVETEGTPQSAGQIKTRLEAFAESIGLQHQHTRKKSTSMNTYVMGIDSGSTSTDAVIVNSDKQIVARVILPTGAHARKSAEAARDAALEKASLEASHISLTVATGYGREALPAADLTITEITCHAKGAHALAPTARTIIDIGGQDSKVIKIDVTGNVETFAMNDKCAAGTGRFLEALARTMEMDLDEFAAAGLKWKAGMSHDITISSMCTVFAESEVISLVADNVETTDIIHGLNKSVAQKTRSLVQRIKATGPYLMTGGVARNKGVVEALSEALGEEIVALEEGQIAGALGAALLGLDRT